MRRVLWMLRYNSRSHQCNALLNRRRRLPRGRLLFPLTFCPLLTIRTQPVPAPNVPQAIDLQYVACNARYCREMHLLPTSAVHFLSTCPPGREKRLAWLHFSGLSRSGCSSVVPRDPLFFSPHSPLPTRTLSLAFAISVLPKRLACPNALKRETRLLLLPR